MWSLYRDRLKLYLDDRRNQMPVFESIFQVFLYRSEQHFSHEIFQTIDFPISFAASCGSLIPFTRANAQWVIHGFTELALKFTPQS